MHIELLELQRRVQGRVPLPSFDYRAPTSSQRHQRRRGRCSASRDIPIDLTDLRLLVRQTADVLRRHGALDDADYQRVQTLGRGDEAAGGGRAVVPAGAVRVRGCRRRGCARASTADPAPEIPEIVGQVLALAMRPLLSRCAEVLQQRTELALWTHPHCALCGGEPDLAVITPGGDRHLICGRCPLRWKFEPLTCPYCRNAIARASRRSRTQRRAVPRVRVRRLPPLPEGVRRASRDAAGDAGGRRRRDAAARRGRDAAGLFELG